MNSCERGTGGSEAPPIIARCVDRYELLNPKVQICGDAAVLTYNFAGEKGSRMDRWNCREVYRRTSDRWRIIQTHWSLTGPIQQ